MKKALCIGVGYTGHVDFDGDSLQLDGSHGDANSIASYLTVSRLLRTIYTITS